MAVDGMLSDEMFNQTYWTVDGKSHSKLLVFDAKAAYAFKTSQGAARHARQVFRPGQTGYTLLANERPAHSSRWKIKIPVRASAMLAAQSTLFVAGTPDVVPADDPWAAIEGRKGGVMWVVATDTGKKLAEYKLDAPPVWNGLATAGKRLYMTCKDGKVLCFVPSEGK